MKRLSVTLVFAAVSTADVVKECPAVHGERSRTASVGARAGDGACGPSGSGCADTSAALGVNGGVEFSFGSSATLARQILAGAPVEVFVSADVAQMDVVERRGMLAPGTRVEVAGNLLVVVVPAKSEVAWTDAKRLSLADPTSVPAGRYAKAWLEASGQWESLKARVIPALDARAALAAVESGRVDAGIVYATDAARSGRVKIVHRVEGPLAPKIRYVAALTKRGGDAARAFLACLRDPKIWTRQGFSAP